jgi:hypothetical protein
VDGDVKAGVTCQLQTRDNDFFYDMLQASVLWEDKYLRVDGEYMEVWCVPSATHTTCVRQSQNQSSWHESVSYLIFGKFFAVSVEAC